MEVEGGWTEREPGFGLYICGEGMVGEDSRVPANNGLSSPINGPVPVCEFKAGSILLEAERLEAGPGPRRPADLCCTLASPRVILYIALQLFGVGLLLLTKMGSNTNTMVYICHMKHHDRKVRMHFPMIWKTKAVIVAGIIWSTRCLYICSNEYGCK